jgi:N-acyl homoserine lactone hydrolase
MSISPRDFDAHITEGLITAHLAATFAGLPVYVHTIEHADGVVLVDTGMLDSTPELDEEGAPVPMPENIPRDVVCVVNTHLHFDHCGGNRLFPGVPIHVQRLELQGPHDPHEWVHFPGATYVEHDGETEVLPASGCCRRRATQTATRASSWIRPTGSSS